MEEEEGKKITKKLEEGLKEERTIKGKKSKTNQSFSYPKKEETKKGNPQTPQNQPHNQAISRPSLKSNQAIKPINGYCNNEVIRKRIFSPIRSHTFYE